MTARSFGASSEPRLSWAVAGGAAPGIGALDAGGGAVAADLGTGAVQDSSFTRIGSECFGTCRIVIGSSPTGVTGYWTITGLPVAPKMDAGNLHGRVIGSGFLIDNSDTARIAMIQVVIDPFFSTTVPVLFAYLGSNATVSATDVLTPNRLGDGSCLCANSYPWALAADDKLNLSFQYEGV